MDQSPLPFDLNKGKTYETTGTTKYIYILCIYTVKHGYNEAPGTGEFASL